MILPFFFSLDGFNYFFYFPSTVSSSFDALGPFAMEVDVWCFASYLVGGYNPWSVLNEHIWLMIILVIIFFILLFIDFYLILIGK